MKKQIFTGQKIHEFMNIHEFGKFDEKDRIAYENMHI